MVDTTARLIAKNTEPSFFRSLHFASFPQFRDPEMRLAPRGIFRRSRVRVEPLYLKISDPLSFKITIKGAELLFI